MSAVPLALVESPLRHEADLSSLNAILCGSAPAPVWLWEQVERDFPVKVFSLPSVDHPQWGRHIELGVKGEPVDAERAYADLRQGLKPFSLEYGPELVR